MNCLHRGALESRDVFACAKHGQCSVIPVEGVRQCAGCPDHARRPPVAQIHVPKAEPDLSTIPQRFDPPARRHLVYHVYPASGNGVWQRGIQQLGLRRELFDGSRTIAVVTGPGLDPPEMVDAAARMALGDVQTLFMPNEPTRREVTSWWPLWQRALSLADDSDAIFYGHSKGATRQVDPGNSCQWWASLLYHVCLDYWPHVSEVLERFEIAGAMKKHGYGFGHQYGRWHYSGTFFWARAGGIRQKISRPVPQVWFGTEAWPGMVYSAVEAGCIFHEGVVGKLNLYDVNYWRRTLLPAFEEWQNARARHTLRIPVLS